jgi:hypothetical protein
MVERIEEKVRVRGRALPAPTPSPCDISVASHYAALPCTRTSSSGV